MISEILGAGPPVGHELTKAHPLVVRCGDGGSLRPILAPPRALAPVPAAAVCAGARSASSVSSRFSACTCSWRTRSRVSPSSHPTVSATGARTECRSDARRSAAPVRAAFRACTAPSAGEAHVCGANGRGPRRPKRSCRSDVLASLYVPDALPATVPAGVGRGVEGGRPQGECYAAAWVMRSASVWMSLSRRSRSNSVTTFCVNSRAVVSPSRSSTRSR